MTKAVIETIAIAIATGIVTGIGTRTGVSLGLGATIAMVNGDHLGSSSKFEEAAHFCLPPLCPTVPV